MSLVRFLTYSNQWDVEGLVATTSIHQQDETAAWRIREIVEAYGEVCDNLELHEPGYPTAEQLLSLVREGRPDYGMNAVGEGMDSPGSEWLIEVVDQDDARPVWVTVWGGPNVLAQALWIVRPLWTDAEDEVMGVDGKWHTGNHETIWRWRPAYQNDFAARMDWTIKPYDEANHPPVPMLGHSDRLNAKPGERVNLSAEGTRNPDGDEISYEWFYYGEPGTFTVSSARTGQPLVTEGASQEKAWFTVPTSRVFRNGTMHIILAVTDLGSPPVTRYQRVIVDVQPSQAWP